MSYSCVQIYALWCEINNNNNNNNLLQCLFEDRLERLGILIVFSLVLMPALRGPAAENPRTGADHHFEKQSIIDYLAIHSYFNII